MLDSNRIVHITRFRCWILRRFFTWEGIILKLSLWDGLAHLMCACQVGQATELVEFWIDFSFFFQMILRMNFHLFETIYSYLSRDVFFLFLVSLASLSYKCSQFKNVYSDYLKIGFKPCLLMVIFFYFFFWLT